MNIFKDHSPRVKTIHTPSASRYTASDVVWPPDDEQEAEDYRAFVSLCSVLNRLPESAEFEQWLAAEGEYEAWLDALDRGHYRDECPELAGDILFDDGPLFGPSQDDLDWLESQRPDCESLPETLAELDREIAETRRVLAETVS